MFTDSRANRRIQYVHAMAMRGLYPREGTRRRDLGAPSSLNAGLSQGGRYDGITSGVEPVGVAGRYRGGPRAGLRTRKGRPGHDLPHGRALLHLGPCLRNVLPGGDRLHGRAPLRPFDALLPLRPVTRRGVNPSKPGWKRLQGDDLRPFRAPGRAARLRRLSHESRDRAAGSPAPAVSAAHAARVPVRAISPACSGTFLSLISLLSLTSLLGFSAAQAPGSRPTKRIYGTLSTVTVTSAPFTCTTR
jgi:hypothetical protein